MTIYVYMSRTVQRLDAAEVDAVGEALMDALRDDPCLKHVQIALIPAAPDMDSPFVGFDVRAEVSADGRDALAVGCAFWTADEAWKLALENVGLIANLVRSQMST